MDRTSTKKNIREILTKVQIKTKLKFLTVELKYNINGFNNKERNTENTASEFKSKLRKILKKPSI